jgi:hypothetical protein
LALSINVDAMSDDESDAELERRIFIAGPLWLDPEGVAAIIEDARGRIRRARQGETNARDRLQFPTMGEGGPAAETFSAVMQRQQAAVQNRSRAPEGG